MGRWPARAGEYVGLLLVPARPLRMIQVVGSRDFANIVYDDADDITGDSWEVWTLVASRAGVIWKHRQIGSQVVVQEVAVGESKLLRVTFALATDDEAGPEADVLKVKLLSRDAKRERLRVCSLLAY